MFPGILSVRFLAWASVDNQERLGCAPGAFHGSLCMKATRL